MGYSRNSQIGNEGGAQQAPSGISSGGKTSSPDEDAARAALLRLVEQARSELQTQLDLLRHQDAASRNLAAIEIGDARVRALDALRERLTAGSGASLGAIRAEVGVAVAGASIGAVQASAAAAMAGSSAQFAISQAEYRRTTADWDRKVAQTYEADRSHFEGARALAQRLGVDVSGFEAERRRLEGEREAARRTGDKIGERKADLGIAENTYGVMAVGLPRITDDEERRQHEERMREQQRIIELRRAARDAQVELEARRQAAKPNLPPQQAESFIEGFRKESRQDLDTPFGGRFSAVTAGAARTAPAANEPSSAATPALDPAAQAREQALAIRKTGEATDTEITLAQQPDAHRTVEVPKLPVNAAAGDRSIKRH